MELQRRGCFKGVLRIETVRARRLIGAALICGGNSGAMWELSEPLYGLSTSRRERYANLKRPLSEKLVGTAALLDKSVPPRP